MAKSSKIRPGTKLEIVIEKSIETRENPLKSTFEKELNEASIMITAPIKGGVAFVIGETEKMEISYVVGSSRIQLVGYVEEYVKKGIRTYIVVRLVGDASQHDVRSDQRFKSEINIQLEKYVEGKTDKYAGATIDISNGGAAVMSNMAFLTGDILRVTFPKRETAKMVTVRSEVCWAREIEKEQKTQKVKMKNMYGLHFLPENDDEMARINKQVIAAAAMTEF